LPAILSEVLEEAVLICSKVLTWHFPGEAEKELRKTSVKVFSVCPGFELDTS
jgi:hypothetical protein